MLLTFKILQINIFFLLLLIVTKTVQLAEKEKQMSSGKCSAGVRPERAGCGLRVAAASAQKMIYIVCVAAARGTGGRFLKQIQSTADMGEYYY